MKSLPFASLALVLALSGCSSSPSIEEQTKLVEYEKCLSFAEMIQAEDLAWQVKQGNIREDGVSIETSIKDCEKYRP